MQIAVISDTHNQLERIQVVADWLRKQKIGTIIHCGDLTDPELLAYLNGLQVFYAFGNGDHASGEILEKLQSFGAENRAGIHLDLNLGGRKIFVTHGHRIHLIEKALASGNYDYVIQGHTHRFCDRSQGVSRLLNPGALGGTLYEPRSFAILNTDTDEFTKILYESLFDA